MLKIYSSALAAATVILAATATAAPLEVDLANLTDFRLGLAAAREGVCVNDTQRCDHILQNVQTCTGGKWVNTALCATADNKLWLCIPREGKASCGDIRDSFGLDDYIEPLTTVSPSATSHTKIAQGIVRPSKTAISAASAATFSDASSQVDALGGPLDPVVQKPATTESATPAFIDVTEAETSTTTAATSTATSTWYPNGGAPFTVEDYYPPHNVVFAETTFKNGSFPTVEQLDGFNRVILGHYRTDGPSGNVLAWTKKAKEERTAILNAYHAKKIMLMFAALGSGDAATTNGVNATQFGIDAANFMREYDLDGVDLRYEDLEAWEKKNATRWIVDYHIGVNSITGFDKPGPMLSHSPYASWFDNTTYPDGGYTFIWYGIAAYTDFFNFRFFNQRTAYNTCQTMIHESGAPFKETSLLELRDKKGIAPIQLVISMPFSEEDAKAGGYMDLDTLGQCVSEAEAAGWNATVSGVAFSDWSSISNPIDAFDHVMGLEDC